MEPLRSHEGDAARLDPFAAARNHPDLRPPSDNPVVQVPVFSQDALVAPDPFAAACHHPGHHFVPHGHPLGLSPSLTIDPFAAARNFSGARSPSSNTLLTTDLASENDLFAQASSADNASKGPSAVPSHPSTPKPERRQLDDALVDTPPAKKAKVNNTVVRPPTFVMYSVSHCPP